MFWSKGSRAFLSLAAAASMLSATIGGLASGTVHAQSAAPEVVFSNTAPITINDAPSGGTQVAAASPYPSNITVSGLTGNIASLTVTVSGISHTFAGDIDILLVGPGGQSFILMPDAILASTTGSPRTFTFSDTAASQLPTSATTGVSGTYRPANHARNFTGEPIADLFPAPAPAAPWGNPGPQDSGAATLNGTFGGTSPNGTWSLYVVDDANGDVGSITGGWSIDITTGGGGPAPFDAVVDYNGDGKTDWSVVRNTGGGTSGQVTWFNAINGGSPLTPQPWGVASDFFVPADFDGDTKDDITVWRPGAQGQFFILQSSNSTVRVDNLGTTGDDPTIIGDYNGDNRDDVAVYRAGATAGAASTWFYRTAPNANYVAVTFGQNGDFVAPGDYDGDNKNDFVIQRNGGTGQGVFYMLLTTGVYTTVVFGNATDVIVPGDYDGDRKTDIATARGESGSIVWRYRSSQTGATVTDTWGASSTDFPVQGDYTGDGKTDYAVWRNGTYFVMTPVTRNIIVQNWGAAGDYPVANYNTH